MSKQNNKRKYPVYENEIHEVEITDLTHEGLGVAHIESYPLFIENALPDEIVKMKVDHVGRRMGYGRAIEIIKKSPHRVEITDEVFNQNGTMPLQHLAYEQQLKFKQNQVTKLLSKIGGLKDVPVLETIGMSHPYGYRNK